MPKDTGKVTKKKATKRKATKKKAAKRKASKKKVSKETARRKMRPETTRKKATKKGTGDLDEIRNFKPISRDLDPKSPSGRGRGKPKKGDHVESIDLSELPPLSPVAAGKKPKAHIVGRMGDQWLLNLPEVRETGRTWAQISQLLGVTTRNIRERLRLRREGPAKDEAHRDHEFWKDYFLRLDEAPIICVDELEDSAMQRATHGTRKVVTSKGEVVTVRRHIAEEWTAAQLKDEPARGGEFVVLYETKFNETLVLFFLKSRKAKIYNLKPGTTKISEPGVGVTMGELLIETARGIAGAMGGPPTELCDDDLIGEEEREEEDDG